MISSPLTTLCAQKFSSKSHCCLGISPFNSYFSEDLIRNLATWGRRTFESVHFFVPDEPSVYTLEAQGYPREKAEWKARRQGQYLKNKIRRALESIGHSASEADEMILDWKRLTSIAAYVSLHEEVNERFKQDATFRAECISASHWVLTQKTSSEQPVTEEALQIAVKYFLAELPLFLDTPAIVKSETSMFCYHQRVEFLEKLYSLKLSMTPSKRQGFLVVSPVDAGDGVARNEHANDELAIGPTPQSLSDIRYAHLDRT